MEKGDREQLQSRVASQQRELTSLERQLHEAKTEADRVRKMKKTAEEKLAELTSELEGVVIRGCDQWVWFQG